jgi:hypothetical protein
VGDEKRVRIPWIAGWREKRRLRRERTGDSPEKLAQRHTPKRDWVERWLWSGGVERRSRFKD